MVHIIIENRLKSFETDIRELCMAFFPYEKIVIGESENHRDESVCVNHFFNGGLTGDRKKDKSEIKRQLYDYLSEITGKKLLWGTLTGIRPVTIVTDMIEKGEVCKAYLYESNGARKARPYEKKIVKQREPATRRGKTVQWTVFHCEPEVLSYHNAEIKNYLKKEYYISDEKADRLIAIAKKEIEVLNRKEVSDYKDRYSMYIGVPFCKSTCLYCSFTSFNISKFGNYVGKYLDALEKELASSERTCTWKPMTLYIGGGTPTSLDEKDFERLLNIVDKYVDKTNCIEYTVEAGRPDTITYEKLKLMKEHGVSRISINPQTFNQKTLDLIGRKHKVSDVTEKYYMAREIGFDNINMDIILGLPDERIYEVMKTLFNIYKLKPDSLTVHSLALKRAARLNYELDSWVADHYLAGLIDMDKSEGKRTIDKMYKYSDMLSRVLKFEPYYLYRQKNMAGNLENVGYSKSGKECIYNIMMMSERHTVHGFGTATTKEVYYENGGKRIENILGYKSVVDYCNNV
ncbi:MAG: coproporphyrinogen dehydrogenase HemZ [Lachnospiraceae bacterium]|nr:coproporphyrinogen dehydrogenase HemZ [Lachnospiraceae bacterium]